MYKEDIAGSVAHAKMLAKCGIISTDDSEKIVDGLLGIKSDIESGALKFNPEAEDIHMSVSYTNLYPVDEEQLNKVCYRKCRAAKNGYSKLFPQDFKCVRERDFLE